MDSINSLVSWVERIARQLESMHRSIIAILIRRQYLRRLGNWSEHRRYGMQLERLFENLDILRETYFELADRLRECNIQFRRINLHKK
jgi:hypothetical protein